VLASFAVALVVAALKYLGDLSKHPLLIAPFAASLVLIFGVIHSPFVQTKNILVGYLCGALSAIILYKLFGANIWTLAFSAGIATLLMEITKSLHPPAVALPVVMVTNHDSWGFLLAPLGAGLALILLCAYLHRVFIRYFPIHVS
jgi:CBS-domain-containing membrane protein